MEAVSCYQITRFDDALSHLLDYWQHLSHFHHRFEVRGIHIDFLVFRLVVIRLCHCLQSNHHARYGTSSDIDEEAPSPVALFAHGYQCDRRVGTSDVPVDGGMIPFAQSLLPLAPGGEGMVSGGSDIRHEYAGKIEDDARCPPFIVVTKKWRA